MKKIVIPLLLAALLVLAGCSAPAITKISDLSGRNVGVPAGTAAGELLLGRVSDAVIREYPTAADAVAALEEGNVDAVVYDIPVLNSFVNKMGYSDLKILDEQLTHDTYGIAVTQGNTELKDTIDEVLAQLRANGIYDEMLTRWIDNPGGTLPDISLSGENGALVLGTCTATEPFSYYDGGQIVGFDIEVMTYVAQKLGKNLMVVDYDFDMMLEAIVSGEVDVISANITITPDRSQNMLFSDTYFESGLGVIVKKV